MGCAKKRINPTVANHVNRNFTAEFTKAVIKAVRCLPLPWKLNNRGLKGHDPQTIAVACLLKVGFNQTYDGIESHIKEKSNSSPVLTIPMKNQNTKNSSLILIKRLSKKASRKC
jgi:hypothetical protein